MPSKKKLPLLIGQYVLLLLCLLVTFLFIIPQSDNFLFMRSADASFRSILDYSLNYGNGRLLGNILGVLISHYFEYAWLFIAACLFVTVFLLNHLLFKQSVYTVFPLALLVVLPSSGVFSECYTLSASFTNFFLPMLLAVICLCLYSFLTKDSLPLVLKLCLSLLLFVFGLASCLFSENSTIVFFTLSCLILAYKKVFCKKFDLAALAYFLSTVLGGIIMVAIPRITQTAQKMDGYRSVSSGVKEILVGAVASFTRFAEIFNSYTLLLFLLSVGLIACLLKQSSGKKFKTFGITFYALYPAFAILMRLFAYQSRMLPVMHLFETLSVAVYLLVFFFVILKIDSKQQRRVCVCGFLILLSSIAPMLLVSQYGHRTYLTSYFTLIFFAVYLIRENVPEKVYTLSDVPFVSKKLAAALLCIAFVFTCGYTTVQLMYNYNIHSLRSAYIEQEISAGSKEIDVPTLPFIAVSIEDEWPNIVSDITEDESIVFNNVDMDTCENAEEYGAVLSNSIFHNLIQALAGKFGS